MIVGGQNKASSGCCLFAHLSAPDRRTDEQWHDRMRHPAFSSRRHLVMAEGANGSQRTSDAATGTNGAEAQTNGTSNSVNGDVAKLAALIAGTNTGSSEDTISEHDLGRLLAQLDDAHGIAQGMESKLDSMLEHLDELLGTLEAPANATTQQTTDATSK